MARTQIKVPFDKQGVLMHYANPDARPDHFDAAHKWLEPEPIELTLHLYGTERGRSAAYFLWTDGLANVWPMFMKDMADLVKNAAINYGVVSGMWIPCKRGQNYGLRYLGPVEEDPVSGLTDRMLEL